MKTLYESLLGDMEAAVNSKYLYYPKNTGELYANIKDCFEHNIIDLNCIDTSKITDMHSLFATADNAFGRRILTGFEDCIEKMDISKWNVSNVKDMSFMFTHSKFNGDISKWDVRNVEDMGFMFTHSKFNGDISKWDVRKVKDMGFMFANSEFNRDISKWNTQNINNMSQIFNNCPIKEKYKPKFK